MIYAKEVPCGGGKDRKKITVPVTFSIFPPRSGGQIRLYHIYKHIARKYDVDFVTFCSEQGSTTKIEKNLYEIKTPLSEAHLKKYWEEQSRFKAPIADICIIYLSELSPAYGQNLKHSIETSDLVILSHPYLYNEMKLYIGSKPFIYEAQDVEYLVKKAVLFQDAAKADELLQKVYDIERECCEKSEMVLTCSQEDKALIQELYKIPDKKIVVVPNGVDTAETKFVSPYTRLSLKKSLEIENEKVALFMGSDHPPNIDACYAILEMAKKTPVIKYLLMGSQCHHFINKKIKLPANVGLLGMVDDTAKQKIFGIVDMALNPIETGSGTNLKMFDYMAAGVPIITTPFGSRGIDNKDVFVVCPLKDTADVIERFDFNQSGKMIMDARRYVEKVFDWEIIVKNVLSYIDACI